MYENEHLVRKTHEEVFGKEIADSLKEIGTHGLIPIEVSVQDLLSIARQDGFDVVMIPPDPTNGIAMAWIENSTKDLGLLMVLKPSVRGFTPWVFNDNFDDFKKICLA